MRVTWFNLMPWPDLPDDFREKNRSVWVDIDSPHGHDGFLIETNQLAPQMIDFLETTT